MACSTCNSGKGSKRTSKVSKHGITGGRKRPKKSRRRNKKK